MEKPIVFIVDDQPFVCKTIETILKGKYETHSFTAGKDAAEASSKIAADIILLDYYMPELTGYEVLMAIRSSTLNSETPVIFITAETNERMKMEMIERGANDYICKPINSSDLHQRINKLLSVSSENVN